MLQSEQRYILLKAMGKMQINGRCQNGLKAPQHASPGFVPPVSRHLALLAAFAIVAWYLLMEEK
jgi:hypothetical protein